MVTSIKHRLLYWFNSAISRFWVQPLEDRIIPLMEKKPGRIPNYLCRLASWWANAGRIIVNELHPFKIRWVSPEWSVTYLGNGERAEFLSSLLFPNQPEEVECRRIRLWQVPALIRKQAREGDLVVCELNQIIRLTPNGIDLAFNTPQDIQQIIDEFDRPLDEIMATFQQHTRQRIRQLEARGFSFEITHSVEDFDLFYHRMYVPYTKERHGGRSIILCNYDYIHSLFDRGVLILVKKDGEIIAGGLRFLVGDTCIAFIMGVLDGRNDLVKQGCVVALAWYGMLWAHQQGAKRYNLGSSFPLTSNGPFNFKRQWGAHVIQDKDTWMKWSFFGKNLSEKLREYLDNLGFITEIDGKHYQVHLNDPVQKGGEADLSIKLQHVSHCGLAGIAVIPPGGEIRLVPVDSARQEAEGQPSLAVQQFPSL